MPQVGVEIHRKGPLFERGKPIIKRRSNLLIKDLVEKGEQRLDQILRPRPGGVYLSVTAAAPGQASRGHYRRNIHGSVENLQGRIDDGGVVYGPWLEGTGSRNMTTRFKGYASFRRVAQWLQQQAGTITRVHTGRLVKELGG